MLLLAALLLVRVGSFCEASAMAADTTTAAMVGCPEKPVDPAEKSTPVDCTMTACVALVDVSAALAAPTIYAAALRPPPRFAQRDGLKPAPATPPPQSV